jgi:hypothetical protein
MLDALFAGPDERELRPPRADRRDDLLRVVAPGGGPDRHLVSAAQLGEESLEVRPAIAGLTEDVEIRAPPERPVRDVHECLVQVEDDQQSIHGLSAPA